MNLLQKPASLDQLAAKVWAVMDQLLWPSSACGHVFDKINAIRAVEAERTSSFVKPS